MTSEELKKRTKALALRVISLIHAMPRNLEGQVISKQLLRSATSVGANYRAACRAQSRAEFAAKMSIVVEEADETLYWLELVDESGLMKPQRLAELVKETGELLAIAISSRKTAKGSQSKPENHRSLAIGRQQSSIATPLGSSPMTPIDNRQSTIVNSIEGRERP